MALEWGRLIGPLVEVIKAALPRLDYYTLRVARVVRQSEDLLTVDVAPEDPRLPSMAQVPFRFWSGASIRLRSGDTVLLGFSEGDPSRPYAALLSDGQVPRELVLRADRIVLGAVGGEPAAKGQTLQDYLEQKLANHTHTGVTTGGGTSGPSPALANPPDVRASNVEVK